MASFPGPKVHRANRRKLGRGQHIHNPNAIASPVASGSDVVVNFDRPVVVNGPLAIAVGALHIVSQTPVTAAQLRVTMSGPVVGLAWNIPAGQSTILTYQGGGLAAASGTF